MGNPYFQRARDAVHEAKQHMQYSSTQVDKVEAMKKVKRAKQALSQAFADSSMAERDQLMEMQKSFYEFAEEFEKDFLHGK